MELGEGARLGATKMRKLDKHWDTAPLVEKQTL